jgi:hypothetical protein
MKRYLALLASGALILAPLFVSGCAVMPVYPDVAGLHFFHGELVAHLSAGIYETAEGTRGACHDLQLASVKESSRPEEARMVAFDPHGTRVVIRLIPVSADITEVRIQAGVVGDEGYSRRILREIQKQMP